MHLPIAVFLSTGIVGGAKWEGKKTAFQDEEEAGASAETTYADELPAAGDPSAAEPSAAAQRSGKAFTALFILLARDPCTLLRSCSEWRIRVEFVHADF